MSSRQWDGPNPYLQGHITDFLEFEIPLDIIKTEDEDEDVKMDIHKALHPWGGGGPRLQGGLLRKRRRR